MSPNTIVTRETVGTATLATLANGLRVIIQEDHRTPVAVCNVWVRVGSNLEPDPVRGWAHGTEHMLFKGTERRGERDFALEVATLGGSTNAGTGYETTNYHITVPSENIGGAVDILCDALFNSTFADEALEAERPVLVHENHMYDDMPSGFGVSWRWAMELAFDASPYQHPIGGRDDALLSTSREQIMDFYRSAYQPDNMTVVIAGDVGTDAMLDMVADTFGTTAPPRAYDLPEPEFEPIHTTLRYRLESGDLQRVYGKMVFPGLSENDPDRPVLAVVLQILADGRSSRLYRRIQEERELVSGITLLSEAGPREGVLVVDFETDPEKTSDTLAAVAILLQEMKDTSPSDEELDRARIRTERSHQFARETVQGTASVLGWHDAMGDLPGAFTFPEQVAAVTGDDVSRVCRRLFGHEACSVVLYAPRDVAGGVLPVDTDAVAALLSPHLGPITPTTTGRTTPAFVPAASSCDIPHDEPFIETVLANGLRLYIRQDLSLPVVSMGLFATGGVGPQGEGRDGLAHLCQQVQIKGTGGMDAATLHSGVESLGASVSPIVSRDHTGIFMMGLTRNLDRLLPTMAGLAARPDFPADEFERERRLALADLRSLDDDPFQAAARELRAAFYPDHPYGAPLLGRDDSLATMTVDDLRGYHGRTWTARNMHMVVSGHIDPEALATRLEDVLSDLPTDGVPVQPELGGTPDTDRTERRRLDRDVRQSVVLYAWRGPDRPNDDRSALGLLQQLLNGQSGRLFEQLRNQRSLCYATGLQVARGFAPGMIVSYVLTDPATEDEAAAALTTELRDMAERPAADDEFERARSQLVGNMLIARQSNSARVSRCAADILYDRPYDGFEAYLEEIRALTPKAVRDVTARYLGGVESLSMVLGPAR